MADIFEILDSMARGDGQGPETFGGSQMGIPFLGGEARPRYAGSSQLPMGEVEADGRPKWLQKMDGFLGSESMQGFGDSLDARYERGAERARMINSIPRNVPGPARFRSQGHDVLGALLNSYLGRG